MIHTTKYMDNLYIFDNGMVRQFLITGADEAILIDTGFAEDHVREAVSAVTDLPVRVIMTHGDPDHAGGLKDFGTCRIHRADWHLLPDGIEPEPLAEGDVFECGGYRLETIEIPGHTYGSVAFLTGRRGCSCRATLCRKTVPSICSAATGIWICISRARRNCAALRIR